MEYVCPNLHIMEYDILGDFLLYFSIFPSGFLHHFSLQDLHFLGDAHVAVEDDACNIEVRCTNNNNY